MADLFLYTAALRILCISAAINVISLPFNSAPYGKHFRSGSGPTTMPASLAWFLMESPTIFLTVSLYPFGRHVFHPLSLLVVFLYLIHYCNRTLIFPLRLRKGAKEFPVFVAAVAFVFNLLNAYVQTRSLSHYAMYEERLSIWSVVAAATSLALERGFSDSIFGMFVVFAALVMYDIQGVRREVGKHAKILNAILKAQEMNTSYMDEATSVKSKETLPLAISQKQISESYSITLI